MRSAYLSSVRDSSCALSVFPFAGLDRAEPAAAVHRAFIHVIVTHSTGDSNVSQPVNIRGNRRINRGRRNRDRRRYSGSRNRREDLIDAGLARNSSPSPRSFR